MLLKTKTHMPKEREGAVLRRDLLDRLEAGRNARLILVSAPAGFGKTTLVSQWLAAHRHTAVWYAIDENDNDPNLFFRYLLSALQGFGGMLKDVFTPLLGSGQLPPQKEIVALAVKKLAGLSRDSFLVLDDYHYIQNDSIHENVDYLLKNLPPRLHVVVSTRQDPRYSLDRLRGRGELCEIRSGELRFSLAEASAYFGAFEEVRLDAGQLACLHHKTEGWIAGLQLACISLMARRDADRFIHEFNGENQFVMDYLMEETFQSLSSPVRKFLIRTSVLRRLKGDLCRWVTGIETAPDLLLEVERSNLFLVPLDREGKWFRYHHLFAELLRSRLQRSPGPTPSALHKAASRWHSKEGSVQEALHHAFASGDFVFAANILEKAGFNLIGNFQLAIADSWLRALPEAIFRLRPLLGIQALWIKVLQENLDGFEHRFSELSATLDGRCEGGGKSRRRLAEDHLSALRIYTLWLSQDNERVIRKAPEALRALSDESGLARGIISLTHAFSLFDTGDILKAAAPLDGALQEMFRENASYGVTRVFRYQAWLERLQGRLRCSLAMVERSLAWIGETKYSALPSVIELYIESAKVLYEKNDLEAALRQAEKCIEYAEMAGVLASLTMGYMIKAFIFQAMDRPRDADRFMERATEAAQRSRSPLKFPVIAAAAAKLALFQGKLSLAEQWAENRALHPDEPFSRIFEYECLAQAGLYLWRRQFRKAEALLAPLLHRCERRQRMESAMKVRILLAGALFGSNDRQAALSILEQALAFGVPEGYVRSFVDSAVHIALPLAALHRRGGQRVQRHLAPLLGPCGMEGAAGKGRETILLAAGQRLTSSEVRILRLIVAGYSNRQIAQETSVSSNTVKTHIRSIYGKLGVHSRAQAVVKAGELLVSER